jgi:hypothetical protein
MHEAGNAMSLRDVVEMLDLGTAINRLGIHGDTTELTLLTDRQFALYLQSQGDNEDVKTAIISEARRIVPAAINRPIPGEDTAHR